MTISNWQLPNKTGGRLDSLLSSFKKGFSWFLTTAVILAQLGIVNVPAASASVATDINSFAVFGAGDSSNSNKTDLGKNVQVNGGMVGSNRSVYMSSGSSASGVRAGGDVTLGADGSVVSSVTSVIANYDVEIKKDGTVTGDIDGRKIDLGEDSTVNGNVVSGDELTLVRKATINGDADAQKAELRDDTTISGTLTLPDGVDPTGSGYPADTTIGTLNNVGSTPKSPQTFTKLTLPTPNVYTPSGDSADNVTVNDGDTADIDPGTYKDLTFKKNSTVNLSSGHYIVKKINGSEKVTINFDLSGGPIIIFASDDIDFGKDTLMQLNGGDATNLYWETADTFKTSSDSTIFGTVYSTKTSSPGSDGISIGKKNTVTGALYSGQQVHIAEDSIINFAGPYWGEPIPTTGALKVTKNTVNGDGTFEFTGDAGDFNITTISGTGETTISDLEEGTYSVSEQNLGEGWSETSNTCVDVEVSVGETAECTITNTYTEPGVDPDGKNQLTLSGTKFNNRNEDRDRDEGEEGLEGWEMRLYVENGEDWELVASDVTDEDGKYKFPAQQDAGTYHVCEVSQLGWHQVLQDWSGTSYHIVTENLSPNADEEGPYCTSITYTDESDKSNKKYFGNALNDPDGKNQLTLSGTKFHNINGDRDRDDGEEFLPDWEMRLYVENGENWDLIDTDTTDEDGVYKFTQQTEAGVYHVCEVAQEGWDQVRQDWSGTPYHIVTDNLSPNSEEEGPYCSTVVYTDEGDKSNKKYFGNRQLSDDEPTVASVSLCKTDELNNPLSGWTLMLTGSDIETLDVPSENSTGTNSSVLSGGVWHVFKAFGTWLNDRSQGPNYVDAEYSTTDDWDTQMDGFTGYGENILDLQVDGEFVDWGDYNSNHEYTLAYQPSVDSSVNFRIFDGQGSDPIEGWYSDNSGSLSVAISEGYVGTTDESGCVAFENIPFGEYNVAELTKTGWENVSGLGAVTVSSPTHEFYVVNKETSEGNGGGNGGGETTYYIYGYKWSDDNYDGVRGEEGWLDNWRLALAKVSDTESVDDVPVEIVAMSLTDTNGQAQFEIPEAGNYVLLEEFQTGWQNTAPAERTTPLAVTCSASLTDLTTCEETDWYLDSFFNVTVPETVSANITTDNEDATLEFGNYQLLVISDENASNVETTSTTITWTTDRPGTSRVVYDTISHDPIGSAPNYGYAFSTTEDSNKVTDHSVVITGLTAGQTYYYRVISSASPEVVSNEHEFSTSSGSSGGSGGSGGGGGGGGVILLSTAPAPTGDGGGSGGSSSNPPGRIAGVTDDQPSVDDSGTVTNDNSSAVVSGEFVAGGKVLGDNDQSVDTATPESVTENTEEMLQDNNNISDQGLNDEGEDCWRILTICWYWWLLLILILLVLYYWWSTRDEE